MSRLAFWIASNKHYADNASHAALRMKRLISDITSIVFVTDEHIAKLKFAGIDHVIYIADNAPYDLWFMRQMKAMLYAVEKIRKAGYYSGVYFDCDTRVISEKASYLFEVPNSFDFSGTHAPGRKTTENLTNVPIWFPEINIGVNPMSFERSEDLFSLAYSFYEKNPDVYGNNDQGPLRDALWTKSETISLYVLPPEWNYRFNQPTFASGEVFVLHGWCKSEDQYDEVAKKLSTRNENGVLGMRAWNSPLLNS